jgi:hypothetical protein
MPAKVTDKVEAELVVTHIYVDCADTWSGKLFVVIRGILFPDQTLLVRRQRDWAVGSASRDKHSIHFRTPIQVSPSIYDAARIARRTKDGVIPADVFQVIEREGIRLLKPHDRELELTLLTAESHLNRAVSPTDWWKAQLNPARLGWNESMLMPQMPEDLA